MFIATHTARPAKLRRSGMNWVLAPADLRQWPSEREYMPLLRSLAGHPAWPLL